jgi:hypothetical protein
MSPVDAEVGEEPRVVRMARPAAASRIRFCDMMDAMAFDSVGEERHAVPRRLPTRVPF